MDSHDVDVEEKLLDESMMTNTAPGKMPRDSSLQSKVHQIRASVLSLLAQSLLESTILGASLFSDVAIFLQFPLERKGGAFIHDKKNAGGLFGKSMEKKEFFVK